MGLSVRRGENQNGSKPQPVETVPLEKAEVVEEEMFATYEEPARSTTPPPESEGERVVLRDLIPDTEEDFQAGFRRLRDHEYQSLGIQKDRSLYRTREDASKNVFKISAARVGQHLTEMMAFKHPPNYFWDSYGMTPECVAELKKKIENTARTVFPDSEWSKYKRGDLKKVGVENPRYKLRVKYWEELAKRSQEYEAWLLSRQPEGDEQPEACEAEWVFDNEPAEEREERHSKLRSQIELVGQQTYQIFNDYFDSLKDRLIKLADDKAIETRLAVDKRYSQTAINPEITTEDDEDL